MIDEPDNWRSIGDILSGMLKRGDLPFELLGRDEAISLDSRRSFCDRQETRAAMTEQNKPLSEMTPEEIAKLTPEQVDELGGIEPQPDRATDSLISRRIEKHRGLLDKLS